MIPSLSSVGLDYSAIKTFIPRASPKFAPETLGLLGVSTYEGYGRPTLNINPEILPLVEAIESTAFDVGYEDVIPISRWFVFLG